MNLLDVFASPDDLLALQPGELAGVLLHVIQEGPLPNGPTFHLGDILSPITNQPRETEWNRCADQASAAIAEAWAWLTTEGLIIPCVGPNRAPWHFLSRQAQRLRSVADIAAYRAAATLPRHLVHARIAEKVWSTFLRGDHDTAAFQAFKEVEVATRKAAQLDDAVHGKDVFLQAFHVETGRLTDQEAPAAEREALRNLFLGAGGFCRNPLGHRDLELKPTEAAQMIVFASYLLTLVERAEQRCR